LCEGAGNWNCEKNCRDQKKNREEISFHVPNLHPRVTVCKL
jgi:hypothetical protein